MTEKEAPEDVEAAVLSMLGTLSLEVLIGLKDHLEIKTVIPDEKRNVAYVRKILYKHFANIEDTETDALCTTTCLDAWMFLTTIDQPDVKTEHNSTANMELNVVKGDSVSKEGTITKEVISKWKKELKISGSIGLPGQKDKITFSSLAYQIENAVKKEYTSAEICEAVVKSISPDLQLRGFLEGKAELTTTLFNQLSNTAQLSTETPLDFVIRLMNLRQKVLFVSKEGDNRFEYSESLLQKQFLHSVVTGLRNDSIKGEMKVLVKQPNFSDEDLLEALNKAVSDENERQGKIKKSSSCSVVGVEDAKPQVEKKHKENPLLIEIRELKTQLQEVAAMKSDVEDLKRRFQSNTRERGNNGGDNATGGGGNGASSSNRRQRGKCTNCVRDNVDRCQHCFKCGGTDHIRAGCRNSEN